MAQVKKQNHAPRNLILPSGVMRFSKARMYQIKGIYKKKPFKAVGKVKPKKKLDEIITKKVGGEKNGGERKVPKRRIARLLDSEREKVCRTPKNKLPARKHVHKLREGLQPGTVVVVLTGRHRGKRVVYLKQLPSGLILVSGPLKLNNCPLRRICPKFVIATKTRLDISKIKLPDHLNDDYFKRKGHRRRRPGSAADQDIFASKKEGYVVSDQRKDDQKKIDQQLLDIVRKHPDKKALFGYLGSLFSLRNGEFPHKMVF